MTRIEAVKDTALALAKVHRPLLTELREQFEAVRAASPEDRAEGFQATDARLRRAFRWLERALTYLNGIKPPIAHRFDLGYGFAFESPRFAHGSVWPHERRINGYPVIDEIGVYYEISASKSLSIEVAPGWMPFAQKTLDAFGLQYTCRRETAPKESHGNAVYSVAPVIPAKIALRADYRTNRLSVTLINVDRLERVSLEFESTAFDEPALEDLVRIMLGRDSAFLKRARLSVIPVTRQ